MGNLFSLVTGAFSGVWGTLAAAALAAIVSGAGVGWTVHRLDQATIAGLRLADAKTALSAANAARALQKKEDAIALQSAVAEAHAQQKIVTQTVTLTREVPVYVTPQIDARTCVTYGLVRLLDAASLGRDPADLSLGPGQSDDACAPVKASDLARSVAENYATARANAEQLNALEAWLAAEESAQPEE